MRSSLQLCAVLIVACARAPEPAASPKTEYSRLASAPASSTTPSPSAPDDDEDAPPTPVSPSAPRSPPDALHASLVRRLAAPAAPSPCIEQDLPAAYRSGSPQSAPDENLGRGLALDLPEGTVTAMHTPVGDAAVYLSYRLDPSSELGDAGYRLKLRDSKTGKTTDVSLGFSNMRPYVVVRNPNLPLLDGDIAQLAVDVRELDDTSVTFPPVALRAKRHATGKMVRCPRAALERDSDHDGLTDLEEDRLATDPSVPDTDGDGLLDGEDPAPLGAAVPSTPEQQLWVSALTQLVAKDTKDELLIVKGGPRLDVRGVRLRLLQLEDDELLLYDKRFGTRVTFDISVTMKTPDEGKVAISYGWRGEEYTATRTGAGAPWKFVAGGMWITRRDERGRSLALW